MEVKDIISQIDAVSYTWDTSTTKLDNIYKIIEKARQEDKELEDSQ